jgi:peptidyl-prolyl cis-trans isomerase C
MAHFIPKFVASVCIALGSFAPIASIAEEPTLETVVASVNGVNITLGHIVIAKTSLPQEYQNLPANVLFPSILEQLIQQTLLVQAFEQPVPKSITLSLENEERALIAGLVVEDVMKRALRPGKLEEEYQKIYGQSEAGVEFNAAHILVGTEDEAKEVKEVLDDGADFGATAREFSIGPSGPRGGGLGWFGEGAMVSEFEAAVKRLKKGEISIPVQTQFGWHVIKLMDIRPTKAPSLDAVKGELEGQIRMNAVSALIDQLEDEARIDQSAANSIDPSVLNRLETMVGK